MHRPLTGLLCGVAEAKSDKSESQFRLCDGGCIETRYPSARPSRSVVGNPIPKAWACCLNESILRSRQRPTLPISYCKANSGELHWCSPSKCKQAREPRNAVTWLLWPTVRWGEYMFRMLECRILNAISVEASQKISKPCPENRALWNAVRFRSSEERKEAFRNINLQIQLGSGKESVAQVFDSNSSSVSTGEVGFLSQLLVVISSLHRVPKTRDRCPRADKMTITDTDTQPTAIGMSRTDLDFKSPS